MIRGNKKFNPDLIISGDWHLRETQPKCRTDDFWKAQWEKIREIFHVQYEHGSPLIIAGDVFHNWKISPYLINKCLKEIDPFDSEMVSSIIGNHDAPQHNIELIEKSGLGVLFNTKKITHLKNQLDWEDNIKNVKPITIKNNKKMVVLHIMTYKGKKPWPGCTDPECHELFDLFPQTDLILTSHNHQTFTARKGKQLLVNPGSITRQSADQINHKPCVFLYDSKLHKLKKHYLEIKDNVISREHIDIKKNKDKRLNAFIEKIKQGWNVSLSFEQNIEKGIKENKFTKKVKDVIYNWMED